jgi:hypothetical protein
VIRSIIYGTSVAPSVRMNGGPFHVSPAVRASITADGLVILDVQRGLVLASNSIGARIWQLIEQRRTQPEIAGQLVEDFGVAVDRAERDVLAFVTSLVERGLVSEDTAC